MVSSDEDEATHSNGSDELRWNSEGAALKFLHEEGLEALALFKSIRDRKKRELIMHLMRALAG